jgi:hypothetical protein
MGGSPTISGGMTFSEQQQLLREEREFQAQQEAQRRADAEASEARRVAREAAERERIKREEEAEIQKATQAEQEAIREANAQAEAGEQQGIAGSNVSNLDFYSSLYTGMSLPGT